MSYQPKSTERNLEKIIILVIILGLIAPIYYVSYKMWGDTPNTIISQGEHSGVISSFVKNGEVWNGVIVNDSLSFKFTVVDSVLAKSIEASRTRNITYYYNEYFIVPYKLGNNHTIVVKIKWNE